MYCIAFEYKINRFTGSQVLLQLESSVSSISLYSSLPVLLFATGIPQINIFKKVDLFEREGKEGKCEWVSSV